MVQFYVLSVLTNMLTGLFLASDSAAKSSLFAQMRAAMDDKGFKFALGLATLIVGLLKILSPIEGDVPIIGDLLPAASGLFTGGLLLMDFFRDSSDIESEALDKLDSKLLGNRKLFGMGAAVIGFLHFLMPGVAVF